MIQEEEPQEDIFDDDISDADKTALLEISKWTRVISAIGFAISVMVVLPMLLDGSAALKQQAAMPGANTTYSKLVVDFFINFFAAATMLYQLYKSSNLFLNGVQQQNSNTLAQGFIHLKNFL
ncbi:hypothetical protein LWM68_01060 [Niabella sp. W65]|nr:hypothetical protein [Niabella sp. W65]MCH7361495.1 hypothetical protein [Niabella sp. W65]ULT45293.1 hypothetical protein KRR40_19640 [Niabella sp. I65]